MIWEDPFNMLEEVVESFFPTVLAEQEGRTTLAPVVISEDKDNYYIRILLPGVEPDKINVVLQDRQLSIEGERKPEIEEKATFLRRERPYGKFKRVINLSEQVDSEKVEASYKNGILLLTLPKKEELKPKQITIKAE